jgi:hypothetical protein
MEIQDSLLAIDFINRKGKEKRFIDNFFQTLQYHIIYAYFMWCPNQSYQTNVYQAVLNFEKTKEVFEWLIIHCGTSFLNK